MIVQEKQGATLLNRIDVQKIDSFDDFRRAGDLIGWIDSQLKAGKFLKTRGREVLVRVSNSSSFNIVTIPRKEEYIEYIKAWIRVYNMCLDYLERSLNTACLENKIIKRESTGWTIPVEENMIVQRMVIQWPKFNVATADYAKGLDKILDRYNELKNKLIQSFKNREVGVSVKKSSVMLSPANHVSLPKVELKAEPVVSLEKGVTTNDGYRVSSDSQNKLSQAVNLEEKAYNPEIKQAIKTEMQSTKTLKESDKTLFIQKVSDGAILDNSDMVALRKQNTDIVVLTCQDVNRFRDEDVFVRNAARCQSESFNTGAFIYGKATDDHMGAIELKRILKMLEKFSNNFSGLVIYSIDNEYAQKNKNSDLKLLDFINVYNAIARALSQAGYNVMLSMDLVSAEIIGDINRRYNMQNEYEVIYMAVVRDMDSVNSNASVIIVDPGNDYDIVNIKNKEISNQLSSKMSDRSLAKVV